MAEPTAFRREARAIVLAWVALIALMLASLGSATLRLGAFNMVAGLVIAGIKTAIVAWLFMRLRDEGRLLRLTAATGLAVWCVLVALSGVDYLTRASTTADVERPRALLPVSASAAQRGR